MSQKKKSSNKGAPSIGAFISFGDVSSSSNSANSAAGHDGYRSEISSKGSGSSGDLQPLYSGSDNDFAVVSKKLLKKDSKTKLKAFNELIELICRTDKQSEIAGFVPYFVYVYLRVSVDNDRKLRELLNIALLSIVVNTNKMEEGKRILGPYMKAMIGQWWSNSADLCSEVARASAKAFESAVPKDKRNQRLLSLSPFILSHVAKNLASKVEELSDLTQCTVEEAEERYERIMISSLISIGNLASALYTATPSQIQIQNVPINSSVASTSPENEEGMAIFLSGLSDIFNEKFWFNMTANKSISIKKAYYDVIGTICNLFPSAINNANITEYDRKDGNKKRMIISKISSIFCQFLGEKTIQNIPPMLMGFLSFTKSFPICWNHIPVDQVLVPKLKSLFTRCPAVALDHLLPIIGAIPADSMAIFVTKDSDDGDVRTPTEKSVRNNRCLVNLLIAMGNTTEQRTFPEELLPAADLCILECSTLLLLRRGTFPKNVPNVSDDKSQIEELADGEKSDENNGNFENNNGDEKIGKKEKKELKKKNKNREKDDIVSDEDINEIDLNGEEGGGEQYIKDHENEVESVETAAARLCELIVKSIALLITATVSVTTEKESESASNSRGSTSNIRTYSTKIDMSTYAPYIGMKIVLTQLQRASLMEINLSKLQWGKLLWQPLAVNLDNLLHNNLMSKIIFENSLQEQNEVPENVPLEEYYFDPTDESSTVEQGSVMSHFENKIDTKIKKRSKKQREEIIEKEVASFLLNISICSYLLCVVKDVVKILTNDSTGANNANTIEFDAENVQESRTCTVLKLFLYRITHRLLMISNSIYPATTSSKNAIQSRNRIDCVGENNDIEENDEGAKEVEKSGSESVRIATGKSVQCLLLSQFICNLIQLSSATSTSTSSSIDNTSVEKHSDENAVLNTQENTPNSELKNEDVCDVLLSDWLRNVCTTLSLREKDIHKSVKEKISGMLGGFYCSLSSSVPYFHNQKGENRGDLSDEKGDNRSDIVMRVMAHCISSNSLIGINIALNSSLFKSLPGFSNLKFLDTEISMGDLLTSLIFEILSLNNDSNNLLSKKNKKNSEINDKKGDRKESLNAELIVGAADTKYRVYFVSLWILHYMNNGNDNNNDNKVHEKAEVNETNELNTVLTLWKSNRSKICMWIMLTVLQDILKNGNKGSEKGRANYAENLIKMGGDNILKEVSEMLLSAYFSRSKETYRTKNEKRIPNDKSGISSTKEINEIILILDWDDLRTFLLPILPEEIQVEFSSRIISSLSMTDYFTAAVIPKHGNKNMNLVNDKKSNDNSNNDEEKSGNGDEYDSNDDLISGENGVENGGFQPRKWARHVSGFLMLEKQGLKIASALPLSQPQSISDDSDEIGELSDATKSQIVDYSDNKTIQIIKVLGLSDINCWTKIMSLIRSDQLKIKTNETNMDIINVLINLKKIAYFLITFLELNEQWKIDQNMVFIPKNNILQDSFNSKNVLWFPIASDVILCEKVMRSIHTVEHFCVHLEVPENISSGPDLIVQRDVQAVRAQLMRTCCDVREVCLSMIDQSPEEIRTNLAIHTLNRALHSTSPTTSNTTVNGREGDIELVDILIARTVVRACLTPLKSGNLNDPRSPSPSSLPLLLPLLRIQTTHTENIPDKGTTVWYVQHKNVQLINQTFSTDVSYPGGEVSVSNSGDFLGVKNPGENLGVNPGVRTVSSLECLEGKLIGIHKDGNEEPFYTVSLSVPIDGTAGNTVREIQTNGYRILLNCPSASCSGEFYRIVTDTTDTSKNNEIASNIMQSSFTMDMVQECAKELKDGNSSISVYTENTKSRYSDIDKFGNQESGVHGSHVEVEVAILCWLESVLSSVTKNSSVYFQGAARNSLQLDFICYWLVVLSVQVEALTLQRNELKMESNCADTSSNSNQLQAPSSNLGSDNSSASYQGVEMGSAVKGTMDLSNLRCVCSQVLSKCRGVSLSLLSCDVIRDTGRFRSGVCVLSALLESPLGIGCGLWLTDILQLLTSAVKNIKTSGKLVLQKEEKEILLIDIGSVTSKLMKISGGRWRALSALGRTILSLSLPFLPPTHTYENTKTEKYTRITKTEKQVEKSNNFNLKYFGGGKNLGYVVLELGRNMLNDRLQLDSEFLPHKKERTNIRIGTVGGADKSVRTTVTGQWVGGTTGGLSTSSATSSTSAIAAVTRLAMSSDDVLDNWELEILQLSLNIIAEPSDLKSIAESSDLVDDQSTRNKLFENAAVAIHALLLNRSRETAGKVISDALSVKHYNSVDVRVEDKREIKGSVDVTESTISKGEKEFGTNSEEKAVKLSENEGENNSENDVIISELASKLQQVVSNCTPHTSPLVRLMASKVLDVWYSAGGGIHPMLLNTQDGGSDNNGSAGTDLGPLKINDGSEGVKEGEEGRNVEGEGEREGGVEDEEEIELQRCSRIFRLLVGPLTANEIVERFKVSGNAMRGKGSSRRGRKKPAPPKSGPRVTVARGTYIPVRAEGEVGENSGEENEEEGKGGEEEEEEEEGEEEEEEEEEIELQHNDIGDSISPDETVNSPVGESENDDDIDGDREMNKSTKTTRQNTKNNAGKDLKISAVQDGQKDVHQEGQGNADDLVDYSHDLVGTMLQWLLCLQRIDSLAGRCFSLRASCGLFLKRSGTLRSAMNLLLRLVPNLVKQRDLPNGFNRLESTSGREGLHRLAALCLFRTVCVLPAMVRGYWSDDCSRVSKQLLSEFVSLRVKSSLVAREVTLIGIAGRANRWNPEELQVRGSTVSGEITAVFTREETKIELKIKLPPTYPLCNVEVECTGKSGVKDGRWRRWVLQIVQLLASQDGSVIDAVLLWKSNLEKEFEGVEPCPICYCILHPKTFSLPTLVCPTCSNKFHSTCLYTWFKSSGKSKCVICQQPIFR